MQACTHRHTHYDGSISVTSHHPPVCCPPAALGDLSYLFTTVSASDSSKLCQSTSTEPNSHEHQALVQHLCPSVRQSATCLVPLITVSLLPLIAWTSYQTAFVVSVLSPRCWLLSFNLKLLLSAAPSGSLPATCYLNGCVCSGVGNLVVAVPTGDRLTNPEQSPNG